MYMYIRNVYVMYVHVCQPSIHTYLLDVFLNVVLHLTAERRMEGAHFLLHAGSNASKDLRP